VEESTYVERFLVVFENVAHGPADDWNGVEEIGLFGEGVE
jgi:hypothetical protein